MGITELKQKHNERIIGLVVTDIVAAGLKALKEDDVKSPDNPLVESCKRCFDDINDSSWDEIRAIIKRSL